MNIISLTVVDLAIAALLILGLAGASIAMHLGLARRLMIAALRTALQLTLIGFILKALFASGALAWVTVMAAAMVLVAGYEVMARQGHRFSGVWGYGLGTASMFTSSFAVALIALIVIVQPDPWYKPQYAIPLLGMLLGNTMNGVALSVDHLTRTALQQRGIIEAQLMLGRTWHDAIGDIQRESTRVGLIPIVNAMVSAGIISLPGLMTGQILSGTPPVEAVKYQILIMFLIAGGTGGGTLIAVRLGARRLFDERHRLRLERLRQSGT